MSLNNCSAIKLDSLFSLLFKSLIADVCIERIHAFIKRLLQMSFINEVSFTAAVLLMVNELFKRRKELRQLLFDRFSMSQDDEELFVDVDDGEENNDFRKNKNQREEKLKHQLKEIDDKDDVDLDLDKDKDDKPFSSEYDPFKIEPKFANADKTMFWELHLLKSYYHPSIQMFARNILKGEPIEYSRDPLQDFSMANFLDKIIFKPAKSAEKLNNMKSKKIDRANEIRQNIQTAFEENEDLKNQNFDSIKSKIVPDYRPDEEYLYLQLKYQAEKSNKKQKKDVEDEDDMDDEEKLIKKLDDECEPFEMSDDNENEMDNDDGDGEYFKGLEDVNIDQDNEGELGEGDEFEQQEIDIDEDIEDDGSMADFQEAPDSD